MEQDMIIIQHILKDMLNLLEEQLNLYKIWLLLGEMSRNIDQLSILHHFGRFKSGLLCVGEFENANNAMNKSYEKETEWVQELPLPPPQ